MTCSGLRKREVIIYSSEEEDAFVAEVPELLACAAHDATQEAALGNAPDAIRQWIDTAMEFGDPIPETMGRRLILALVRKGDLLLLNRDTAMLRFRQSR